MEMDSERLIKRAYELGVRNDFVFKAASGLSGGTTGERWS
jgi:hypothetical protein